MKTKGKNLIKNILSVILAIILLGGLIVPILPLILN